MFSLRGLLYLTLFVACVTTLGQFGSIDAGDEPFHLMLIYAAVLELVAFWSILCWIREVERLRSDHGRFMILFADITAFAMFTCQLIVTAYVFGIRLTS